MSIWMSMPMTTMTMPMTKTRTRTSTLPVLLMFAETKSRAHGIGSGSGIGCGARESASDRATFMLQSFEKCAIYTRIYSHTYMCVCECIRGRLPACLCVWPRSFAGTCSYMAGTLMLCFHIYIYRTHSHIYIYIQHLCVHV